MPGHRQAGLFVLLDFLLAEAGDVLAQGVAVRSRLVADEGHTPSGPKYTLL